jgi:hypothetical protein
MGSLLIDGRKRPEATTTQRSPAMIGIGGLVRRAWTLSRLRAPVSETFHSQLRNASSQLSKAEIESAPNQPCE